MCSLWAPSLSSTLTDVSESEMRSVRQPRVTSTKANTPQIIPEFELRDGVPQQSRRNGDRKEETVAPPAEARNLGAVLGRVRVGEVAAKHGFGGMGRGRWGCGRCGGGAVTARRGEQGRDPLVDLVAAKFRKPHDALGVVVEAPVRLVERIHDEAPRVHDADDVLEKPGEFAVVAEAHRRVGVDERPQRLEGLERLGVRDNEGADHGVGKDAKPGDGAAGLPFFERRHLDANGRRDVAPVAQHRERAVDAEGEEVAVVRVAARRDEAVLARAEGSALRVEGLVCRVLIGRTQSCLVLVHTPAQQPQNAFGEALGDV